jgi:hypothetical protein
MSKHISMPPPKPAVFMAHAADRNMAVFILQIY